MGGSENLKGKTFYSLKTFYQLPNCMKMNISYSVLRNPKDKP